MEGTPKHMNDEDRELLRSQNSQLIAQTMKLNAEASKIMEETRYYPLIALGAIVVGALGALGTMAILVVKLVF